MSQVLALKGPSAYAYQCLLIGHDQTCRGRALTAEFDPTRTLERCGHYSGFAATLARTTPFGALTPSGVFLPQIARSAHLVQGVLPRIEAGWPGNLSGGPTGTSLSSASRYVVSSCSPKLAMYK